MKVGDKITIKASKIMGGITDTVKNVTCTVCGVYNGFLLLNVGKYKVCAFLSDILKQNPVYI